MTTFELLHKKVQAFIYKQRWDSFRPIQDDSIRHIYEGIGNLLICAPTASGKTEAAFLPIVSKITDDFSGSFRALYISPLKALINDQFKRIDHLCRDINIPVTKWHGDVGQHLKSKALKQPSGILLITPESLEAMLINKPVLARGAFSHLQFVVIDEIHSFVGTERGAQLRSILTRIEDESKCKPIRIALSATVGNPDEVARWYSGDGPFKTIVDNDWDESSGVSGMVKGFTSKIPDENNEENNTLENLSQGFLQSIYNSFQTEKNLIFGNSKKRLEETAYTVKQISENQQSEAQFLIHHGSLSKETREFAEEEIKESSQPTTVFCTSTLEMGIDIGAIDKVGIIDPPWSVSGFAQRIGRSGRREGTPKKFEFFVDQTEINADSPLTELLREDLVKSIAIIQLYLQGFKEPLRVDRHHLSTLNHQILSFCVQKTGAKETDIYENVFAKGFRKPLSDEQFKLLLHGLVEKGFLFIDGTGLYSAGRVGEKLVEHYEFYSVFLTSHQWTVVNDGQLIGEIPIVGFYRENDHILLGGRVWLVKEVVESAKRLVVAPAKNAKAPIFSAAFGITHKKIHEKMREVYLSKERYSYLNNDAYRLLTEGRKSFEGILKGSSVPDSARIPMFEGTVVQNTVSCLLDLAKVEHGISEVCLEVKDTSGKWIKAISDLLSQYPTPSHLASILPRSKKEVEKYDRFLPDELLDIAYAFTYIDIENTKKWLGSLQVQNQEKIGGVA